MAQSGKWHAFKEAVRHAFAVPTEEAEPTSAQQRPVDWVCSEIARREVALPARIGLEMSRPLNYLAAQGMHFFGPGVWAIVKQQSYEDYQHFAAFLEQRGAIDYVLERIEHFEQLQPDKRQTTTTESPIHG